LILRWCEGQTLMVYILHICKFWHHFVLTNVILEIVMFITLSYFTKVFSVGWSLKGGSSILIATFSLNAVLFSRCIMYSVTLYRIIKDWQDQYISSLEGHNCTFTYAEFHVVHSNAPTLCSISGRPYRLHSLGDSRLW
jgi:hypothetical protein